jgi:hypothetical protein
VALLLTSGAEVNARACNGTTPLAAAMSKGHKGAAEVLLAGRANIDFYVDIDVLYRGNWISATGVGNSITDIWVSVKNLAAIALKVRIPHGTYFVSDGNHQNMAARKEYLFDLPPLDTKHVSIAASCINAGSPIPKPSDRFSGVARVSESLSRFLRAAADEDAMTIQAGVWALTDGYTRSEIRRHLVMRGAPSGTDDSAISHDNIDRAKALLDKLGIQNRLR